MNNRFLKYKYKHTFMRDLDAGLIKSDAIVFIEYPRCMWTHDAFWYSGVEALQKMTPEEVVAIVDDPRNKYSGGGGAGGGLAAEGSVDTVAILNNTILTEDLSEEVQALLSEDITPEEASAIWQEALANARGES